MSNKKGRPQKSNNNIIINDISVQYLSTKTDKFENDVAYFKILDSKNKMKPLFDTQTNNKEIRIPLWLTADSDIILKVKSKWLNVSDDLVPLADYMMNVDFNSFSMDVDGGDKMNGYYAKVIKIKLKKLIILLKYLKINNNNIKY